MNSSTLSIVIPIYNEEKVIPHLRETLENFKHTFAMPVELILVNDGSKDQTQQMLDEWSKASQRIFVKHLPINLGHQAAMQAGIELARGDYVVTMDADLQDPVEVIPEFVEKANQGFDIVHARRSAREGEALLRKASAWLFYRILRIINQKILVDVGDFRLLTKKALREYLSTERQFMRGELIHLPFKQTVIFYQRKPRIAGVSKFSLAKLGALAWMGFRSSSVEPKVSNPLDKTSRVS